MRTATCLCALWLLWPASAVSGPYVYVPNAKKLGAGQAEDGKAIVYADRSMAIRIEMMTHEQREGFMAARHGRSFDPFEAEAGTGEMFLVFLLQIENRSHGRLYFNPGSVYLSGGGGRMTPLGYTLQYTYLEAVVPDPKLLPVLMESIYESSELLGPGEKVSKLLVFGEAPGGKKITLEVGPLDFGIDLHTKRPKAAWIPFKFKAMKTREP